MKIQNKIEIDLTVEDVKMAIAKYLHESKNLSLNNELIMHFHVVNKPAQHQTYLSDTVNKFVFDGVTVVLSQPNTLTKNDTFRCYNCYRTVDSYFYKDFCKFCYDKGIR